MRSSSHFSASAVLAALLLLITCAACSSEAASPSGSMLVTDAWVRPVASGDQPSAAYLHIVNGTGQADALMSVSSPVATTIEMHETAMDSAGMVGMDALSRIDVRAGATVTLAPGGMHLMVMGLTRTFQVGDSLELDLVFFHAGRIVVRAQVRQG